MVGRDLSTRFLLESMPNVEELQWFLFDQMGTARKHCIADETFDDSFNNKTILGNISRILCYNYKGSTLQEDVLT